MKSSIYKTETLIKFNEYVKKRKNMTLCNIAPQTFIALTKDMSKEKICEISYDIYNMRANEEMEYIEEYYNIWEKSMEEVDELEKEDIERIMNFK